jgi:hypothetical protein
MNKNYKYFTAENKLHFFDQKLLVNYSLASIKDAQATGESFSPQKKTFSTSKHEISLHFPFL